MALRVVIASTLIFLSGAFFAYAQTAPDAILVSVSCAPDVPVAGNGTFASKRGDAVSFTCTLTNKGAAKAVVLLSGVRTEENAADPDSVTSVAFPVEVAPQDSTEAVIPFIPPFKNGTYRYEITLADATSGEPFGPLLSFSSTLDAPSVRIVNALLDKEMYTIGDPVSLALTVATTSRGDKGEVAESFFFDVVVKGEGGEACKYAVSNRQVTRTEEPVSFSLSALSGGCSAAAVGIILHTKDGFPQDSRDVPVFVRAADSVITGLAIVRFVLSLFAVLALAALAWALRMEQLRRTKEPVL